MTQQEKVWTAEEFMEMSEAEFERVDENPLVLCRDGKARRFDEVETIYGANWAIVGFDVRVCDHCLDEGYIEIPVEGQDATIEPCICEIGKAYADDQAHDGRE